MIIKKINAIVGLASIFFLLAHCLTMTYSMATGWYDFFICKNLAHITGNLVLLHVLLVFIIIFFLHDTRKISYPSLNIQLIIQRASSILILILLFCHVKDFGFIVAGQIPSSLGKIRILAVELLFFMSLFSHIGTSFTKALITLGLIGDYESCKRLDRIVRAVCLVLFLIVSFVLCRFIITFGGH